MNLDTPYNFVSNNDVVGGNSGSAVINKNAEVIGLIFDCNMHALGGIYGYDQKLSRAVAVNSLALTEALKYIYGADRIVAELQ